MNFLNQINLQNLKYFFVLLGAVLFLALSVLFLIKKIRKNKTQITDINSVLMFVFVWASAFFILIYADKTVDGNILSIVESAYSALKMFYADGTARFNLDSDFYTAVFRIAYYVIAFYAPLSLIYTVLASFDNVINKIKIKRLAKKRNVFVFNELNDRSLAIAENYCKNFEGYSNFSGDFANCKNDFYNCKNYNYLMKKNKKLFLFCDVYKQNTEVSNELISKALSLGGLVFKDDIVSLHRHTAKSLAKQNKKLVSYFLCGYDETENVRHAVEIAKLQHKTPVENFGIFTFAGGQTNGHIIESLNKTEAFFVKRLNPALMMAMDVVSAKENQLVNTANAEKDLNVLIVGVGNYGLELCKTLSWYYQRKSGKINLHLIDKNATTSDKLLGLNQAFFDGCVGSADRENFEQYEIKIHSDLDVFGPKFTEFLNGTTQNECGFDAIFVAMGDDNLNTDAALHIRRLLDRNHFGSFAKINENFENFGSNVDTEYFYFDGNKLHDKIKIFSIVHNDQIKANIDDSSEVSQNMGVAFVGSNSCVYSCNNIFNSVLESQALSHHINRGQTFTDYTASEYNILSSLSEVVHHKFIDSLYTSHTEDYIQMRQKIGNKRWNTFLRGLGYISFDINDNERKALFDNRHISPLPKRHWHRGKWHNSIVEFDRLPKREQENNYKK